MVANRYAPPLRPLLVVTLTTGSTSSMGIPVRVLTAPFCATALGHGTDRQSDGRIAALLNDPNGRGLY